MKGNKSLFILILVFVLILGGAFVLYQTLADTEPQNMVSEEGGQADGQEEEAETTAAPNFTVTDSAAQTVSLSDFAGKPVVLNFWASWCGPCTSEMPAFEAAFARYGTEVHFVMVNLTDGSRETAASAQEYIDDQGYTFPVYFDTEFSAAAAYSVTSIPATYFIDAQGNIVSQARGALDEETLQQGLDMILQ